MIHHSQIRKATEIKIGDTVGVKTKLRMVSFGDETIVMNILSKDGTTTLNEIVVPRFISALGQFMSGQNWFIPMGKYELTDDFSYTGRYVQDDNLMIASQMNQKDLDSLLEGYIGEVIDGLVLWGKVVYIYARYFPKGEHTANDIEFFETSTQALHDHYAHEVLAVIQDQGSDIEYSLPLKFLKKI